MGGMFVVSIDLEMAWGRIHKEDGSLADFGSERAAIGRLLSLLDEHDISATWAAVGHLFLNGCGPFDGIKHPEIVRPGYQWKRGDWLDADPVGNVDTHPEFYAPDVIRQIVDCPTHQELGSHSFTHLIVGDPGCSAESFRSDLAAAKKAAAASGASLRSFVFPRNSIGHLDVLAESGFDVFRGPRRPVGAIRAKPLLRIMDKWIPNRTSAVHPRRSGRLVDVPQTHLFDPDSNLARRLGTRAWTASTSRRLRHAARTESLFHLWLHPHNLTSNPTRAWPAMAGVLGLAEQLIRDGRLVNLTMSQVADLVAAEN